MGPVDTPYAPCFITSATIVVMLRSSAAVGARGSLSITTRRTWPRPTYDSRLTEILDRSIAAKYPGKSVQVGCSPVPRVAADAPGEIGATDSLSPITSVVTP